MKALSLWLRHCPHLVTNGPLEPVFQPATDKMLIAPEAAHKPSQRLIPLAPALPTFGDERAIGARLQPATDKMLIAPEAAHKPLHDMN